MAATLKLFGGYPETIPRIITGVIPEKKIKKKSKYDEKFPSISSIS